MRANVSAAVVWMAVRYLCTYNSAREQGLLFRTWRTAAGGGQRKGRAAQACLLEPSRRQCCAVGASKQCTEARLEVWEQAGGPQAGRPKQSSLLPSGTSCCSAASLASDSTADTQLSASQPSVMGYAWRTCLHQTYHRLYTASWMLGTEASMQGMQHAADRRIACMVAGRCWPKAVARHTVPKQLLPVVPAGR